MMRRVIHILTDDITFPSPFLARGDGPLAVGGDLSVKRLIAAYSQGIFPWYSEGTPILWWSPDPRLVLFPKGLKVARSLRQTIRKGIFKVTTDRAFEEVIHGCATASGRDDEGTWLTDGMIAAYIKLHKAGHAHSIESWYEGELAGGLYGVSIGTAFFGESMFYRVRNASRAAFVHIVERLCQWGFTMIDCQVNTEYLRSFGAVNISRDEFLSLLSVAIDNTPDVRAWKEEI